MEKVKEHWVQQHPLIIGMILGVVVGAVVGFIIPILIFAVRDWAFLLHWP
jgi:uncharacterized membrane protein YoaK (UPF0700 family)